MGEVAVTVQPAGAARRMVTRSLGRPVPLRTVVVAVMADPGSATGGASRTSPPRTTTTADPSTPSTVTVIVATPSPTALPCPVPLTVTTLESLLW